MKQRKGFVSNSSSTSFMIDTSSITDREVFDDMFSMFDEYEVYVKPEFEDRNKLYVSTGISDDNLSLINWWTLKKFLDDKHISYTPEGSGVPEDYQKVFDLVSFYICPDNGEVLQEEVSEFKRWLFDCGMNVTLDGLSNSIGVTKEDIIKDITDIHNPFYSEFVEIFGDIPNDGNSN